MASLFSFSLSHVLPRFLFHCRMFFLVFVFNVACSSPFFFSLPHVLPRFCFHCRMFFPLFFHCRMFFPVFVSFSHVLLFFRFHCRMFFPVFVFIFACSFFFRFHWRMFCPFFVFIAACSSPCSFSLALVLPRFRFHCLMFFQEGPSVELHSPLAAALYVAGRSSPQLAGGSNPAHQAAVLQHCFYAQDLGHLVASWVAPTQVRVQSSRCCFY